MLFDVVIVGGGLAGLALASALRDTRLKIALVEGRAPTPVTGWDARVYAITPANAEFLQHIGVLACDIPVQIPAAHRCLETPGRQTNKSDLRHEDLWRRRRTARLFRL